MPFTDFYIQKKIQGGDIREFEQLFVTYYEPLCQLANKILRDMDTSEDIVQEFFYTFWKNRATFSLKLSLKAYLMPAICSMICRQQSLKKPRKILNCRNLMPPYMPLYNKCPNDAHVFSG
jgi:hypothetical protein